MLPNVFPIILTILNILNVAPWCLTPLKHSLYSNLFNTNLLLAKLEGCTGEYWHGVVALQTSMLLVRMKTTKDQYSPVRLKLARLVSSLLHGTQAMLVLNLPAIKNKNTKPMTISVETVRIAKS